MGASPVGREIEVSILYLYSCSLLQCISIGSHQLAKHRNTNLSLTSRVHPMLNFCKKPLGRSRSQPVINECLPSVTASGDHDIVLLSIYCTVKCYLQEKPTGF